MKKRTKIIEVLLFIFLALLVSIFHEPWADEAQAWLIARDCSILKIFSLAKYEGTIPLWHLIIKLFISLKLNYNYYYIIPIIISTLGLILLVNNENIPKSIRILLPFTYYIFYQYTVIARNYCLLFLAFSILLYTFNNRTKNLLAYFLNLILFSLISLHGAFICAVLSIEWIIKLCKNQNYRNLIIYGLLLFIIGIAEIMLLLPVGDVVAQINIINTSFLDAMISIFNVAFCRSNGTKLAIAQNIITFVFFISLFIYHSIKSKNHILLILNILLFLFIAAIKTNSQHIGILYETIIFSMLIDFNEVFNKKALKNVFVFTLILYIVFTFQASINDIRYNYDGSKEMANYIKNNLDIQENDIHSFHYKIISILPYFDVNILDNDSSYYLWSENNSDLSKFTSLTNDSTDEELLELINSDKKYILINSITYTTQRLAKIVDSNPNYKLLYFSDGNTYFKNSEYSFTNLYLYEKIN